MENISVVVLAKHQFNKYQPQIYSSTSPVLGFSFRRVPLPSFDGMGEDYHQEEDDAERIITPVLASWAHN